MTPSIAEQIEALLKRDKFELGDDVPVFIYITRDDGKRRVAIADQAPTPHWKKYSLNYDAEYVARLESIVRELPGLVEAIEGEVSYAKQNGNEYAQWKALPKALTKLSAKLGSM